MTSSASSETVGIVPFAARHAGAWRTLNEAWISRWFTIEPKDRLVLDDPEGQILQPGGMILMAERGGEAIGCVGLIRMADGGMELAKMAVAEAAKGGGVGRLMIQACIAEARAAGAHRLYLESNAILTPALTLYRSSGFQHLPPRATPYARADVFMEMRL